MRRPPFALKYTYNLDCCSMCLCRHTIGRESDDMIILNLARDARARVLFAVEKAFITVLSDDESFISFLKIVMMKICIIN